MEESLEDIVSASHSRKTSLAIELPVSGSNSRKPSIKIDGRLLADSSGSLAAQGLESPTSDISPVFEELSNEELEYMHIAKSSSQVNLSEFEEKPYLSEFAEKPSEKMERRLSGKESPSKESLKKFKKHFPELAATGEQAGEGYGLLKVYNCAYDKDGSAWHGKIYLTRNDIAFHGSSFARSFNISLQVRDLCNVSKKSTAGIFPSAIRLSTEDGKDYVFTSFSKRDAAYEDIVVLWNIYLSLNDRDLKRASVSNFMDSSSVESSAADLSPKRSRSKSSASQFLKNSISSTSTGDMLLRKKTGWLSPPLLFTI
ncbi:MAG: hypothetical protein SGCHY_000384 [Lobulomycetales sp.]